MTEVDGSSSCGECGREFPVEYHGPCIACGNPRLTRVVSGRESIRVSDSVAGESRREFLEHNPKIRWSLWAVSVGAPFLGLVLAGWAGVIGGLVLAVLSQVMGPKAVMKVREIRHF
jgi:hypothetical protein